MDIRKELFKLQDIKYRDFHAKLMPNIKKELIIGVRVPQLRKFAKSIAGTDAARKFLEEIPHKYYEENNLHAFLTEEIKDYAEALAETEKFLPYIDNWATCDSFKPKVFKKNTDELVENIYRWLESDGEYTVRYAIGLLLSLYLDKNFLPEYLEAVAKVQLDEYYVKMMQAWYFATALDKQYDSAVVYFTDNRLDEWVHNKAIQKATESRRISHEVKAFLKTLKK